MNINQSCYAIVYYKIKSDFGNSPLCDITRFLAWAWLAKPKAIVIVYQLFRPCHAFTEITEKKKTEEKCEPQLAKHINALQKRPVETKIYFQLNMIVSFKFKRNTEIYLILIVRNGLIENFEIR